MIKIYCWSLKFTQVRKTKIRETKIIRFVKTTNKTQVIIIHVLNTLHLTQISANRRSPKTKLKES